VTRVELTENGHTQAWLTPQQGSRLAASGVLTAAPSPYQPGLWDLATTGTVGAARIGDVEVWIAPKLTIQRLLFLIGYAIDPKGWREDTVLLDTRHDLVPAVAQALWRQSERAIGPGLLQGYRTVEESSLVLRGRLREADQVRRRHGLAIPMEIRHDEYTVDIPENQILLGAATRMLSVPRVDAESRRRLAALRIRLADVTAPRRGTRLPAWQPTRLNHRYHTALRLAEIIWQATAPEHLPGSTAINGFLFTMWKIFEDFITVAFCEAMQTSPLGTPSVQCECYLDVARAVRMRPDLVWRQGRRPMAVLDAKYKHERPAGYPDADLYQMLAYCTALGLRRGHLIYAAGAEPARHVVQHTGIEIHCHAVDLTQPPPLLLAQIRRIGDDLLSDPLPP
jgi:5-methylcytosine-specific restriction enzyme subunit McrC